MAEDILARIFFSSRIENSPKLRPVVPPKSSPLGAFTLVPIALSPLGALVPFSLGSSLALVPFALGSSLALRCSLALEGSLALRCSLALVGSLAIRFSC